VADNKRNVIKPSSKVPHISALFQLKLDYSKIISFKCPLKNYTEISPMKAAMIQAHRQTEKYEAKWRHCGCPKRA
jgi:cytochrome bd-type quinol oxidase subunit 1